VVSSRKIAGGVCVAVACVLIALAATILQGFATVYGISPNHDLAHDVGMWLPFFTPALVLVGLLAWSGLRLMTAGAAVRPRKLLTVTVVLGAVIASIVITLGAGFWGDQVCHDTRASTGKTCGDPGSLHTS